MHPLVDWKLSSHEGAKPVPPVGIRAKQIQSESGLNLRKQQISAAGRASTCPGSLRGFFYPAPCEDSPRADYATGHFFPGGYTGRVQADPDWIAARKLGWARLVRFRLSVSLLCQRVFEVEPEQVGTFTDHSGGDNVIYVVICLFG